MCAEWADRSGERVVEGIYMSKVWVRTEKTVVVLFSFMPRRAVLILLYLLMLHGMCKNKGSLLTMMGGCKHARDASNSKEFKYE